MESILQHENTLVFASTKRHADSILKQSHHINSELSVEMIVQSDASVSQLIHFFNKKKCDSITCATLCLMLSRLLVVKSPFLSASLAENVRALCNYGSFYLQCLIHSLTESSPPYDTPNSQCTACTHSSKALSKRGNCKQMIG